MDEHIKFMSKPSNRDKILTAGLRVVHERGFGGASVRDIVQAAGVPQGSFTNHFPSKEAFGLEILDLYFARGCETIQDTLRNDLLSPLRRLRAYIEATKSRPYPNNVQNGCLLGNLTAETGDCSEAIRQRLGEIFAQVQQSIAYCLNAAKDKGEISGDIDCEELAGFIVSSLQGAILLSKAERSVSPIERFEHILFSLILH